MNNNLETQILESIDEFNKYANSFVERLQSEYNFSEAPLIAMKQKKLPKKSRLEINDSELSFQFHGIGCEFILSNGLIIDFNFQKIDGDFIYKGFSEYYLFQYMKSIGRVTDKEKFEFAFQKLLSEKKIKVYKYSDTVYNI